MAQSDRSATGFAAQLRGFGILGVVAVLVILAGVVFPPIAAALVLLWAWASRTPFRELGLKRPTNWARGLILGALLGIGLKLLTKAVILPLLGLDAVNSAFQFVVGNLPAAAGIATYAIIGAGFCEELVFRGYLFERFGHLLGRGIGATLLTILATTTIFAGVHFQQGPIGLVTASVVGFALASVYAISGRRLWTPMVAHATFDLVSVAIVYFGMEERVSHLFIH